jgi:hypothetical protein
MEDLDGPLISKCVYGDLAGKMDTLKALHFDDVAVALDAAVRMLRETGAHPSRWATYVHFGA